GMVAAVAQGGIDGRMGDHRRELGERGRGHPAAVDLDAAGRVAPHLQNGALAAVAELGARDDRLSRSGDEELAHDDCGLTGPRMPITRVLSSSETAPSLGEASKLPISAVPSARSASSAA